MFKDARRAGWAFLATVLVALIPFGCSNSDGPTQNGAASGSLEVFFDPNPAPVTGYGQYVHEITVPSGGVGVPGGVGVFVHGAVREPYSAAGEPYATEIYDENWFKAHFQFRSDEGAYMPAGEARCVPFDWEEFRNNGYEDWTFLGEDELGNEVNGTGRLYFGAPQQ